MKLIIEVKLDNEAMQNPNEVSHVLRKVSEDVESSMNFTELKDGSFVAIETNKVLIKDKNGNSVGTWQVKD